MAKKRTKKQKIKAQNKSVNNQLKYNFSKIYNSNSKIKSTNITEYNNGFSSIKKDLFKSLFVAILVLVSLIVVYLIS